MNKTLVFVVGAILVLGGAGWYFMAQPSGSEDGSMMEKGTEFGQTGDSFERETDAAADMTDGATMEKKDEAMTEGKDGAMMGKGDTMSAESGSYEAYAPEKLALAETGKVVLFFRASWCPTCRSLDADIRAHLKDIPAGVTLLDVDYDSSTALKQKYGVTYQHTFVQVDAAGAKLAKWAGSPTLASVLSEIR